MQTLGSGTSGFRANRPLTVVENSAGTGLINRSRISSRLVVYLVRCEQGESVGWLPARFQAVKF